jgi:hypothetical protein
MSKHGNVVLSVVVTPAASQQESFPLAGESETDGCSLSGVRKGRRGHGTAGKVPGSGLLKRGSTVYTVIIPDARTSTRILIIARKRTSITPLSSPIDQIVRDVQDY